MQSSLKILAALTVAAAGFAGVFVQDQASTPASAAPQEKPQEQPPEGEGFPMPKPGPEHEMLAKSAGTWDAAIKMRHGPEDPWMPSKGVETREVACGGFWVLSKTVAEMGPGMTMEGRMNLGYDQNKKKYVGTWIDNFGSYQTAMEGDYDKATKTLTLWSMMPDMEGNMIKTRMDTKHVDADTAVFSMWMPGEGEEYWQTMEITYKRRK